MFKFVLCLCVLFGIDSHIAEVNILEKTRQYWTTIAENEIKTKLFNNINRNKVKNIILFLGDGMSFTTIAAARSYYGKLYTTNTYEDTKLSFENFPYTGIVKTYCVDNQVADSACSATAYLCGVKGNYGTVGVTGAVSRGNCSAQTIQGNRLSSIAAWAQDSGMKTGIVTTARVTHASPSGIYANIADRRWENDAEVLYYEQDPDVCIDIARQLVHGNVGSKLDVILGGGRRNFLPVNDTTQADDGERYDNRNLINEWIQMKGDIGETAEYVYNRSGLNNIDYDNVTSLLGLFSNSHMRYHLDANNEDPSLVEMTQAALKVLKQNDDGFFLFVEAGKIDMAHHESKARKALDETAELSKAVDAALDMVNLDETLIIVTADHSHTLAYSGYSKRGSDVLGYSQNPGQDGKPYMILSYANGPWYKEKNKNITDQHYSNPNFVYPSLIPLDRETHGGEDVPIYTIGPWSHLFTGNFEQNLIPHMIAYAACIGDGITSCNDK